MAVKPILFNTEMVRAILDGRKSVTRRVVKSPYYIDDEEASRVSGLAIHKGTRATDGMPYPGAPYRPGDILYVRETWAFIKCGNCYACEHPQTVYDGKRGCFEYKESRPNANVIWHPSIHMPKEAARLFLRVTGVSVERLRPILPCDIQKEGCSYCYSGFDEEQAPDYEGWMRKTWDSTIQKADIPRYGWAANPWVWVIEFERCERP